MQKNYIFSSESVTEGHPDKICDTISDAVLDACLAQDINSRVACETFVKDNIVGLAGEISTNANINYQDIVKKTIREIGYYPEYADNTPYSYQCKFSDQALLVNLLGQQSADIAQGVDAVAAKDKLTTEQGAGDQGIMFGYATNETAGYLPAPIYYAHQLAKNITALRKNRTYPWLRPDAKTQVSMQYYDNKPSHITTVVISTMHAAEISTKEIREVLQKELIAKTIPAELLRPETEILINPTGLFVTGGPEGDAGLTGRKIIIDTYGGVGRHGGGAFSGKDPSKVDRSAAYMCRWVAKNIIAAGLADRCELQTAYAIGHPHPVSLYIDTFGTQHYDEAKILSAVKEVFSFKPADIIDQLNLMRPIYQHSTNYGHFGATENFDNITWEATNKTEKLLQAIK